MKKIVVYEGIEYTLSNDFVPKPGDEVFAISYGLGGYDDMELKHEGYDFKGLGFPDEPDIITHITDKCECCNNKGGKINLIFTNSGHGIKESYFMIIDKKETTRYTNYKLFYDC